MESATGSRNSDAASALLWQLYPSYLVITLLPVVGLGWLATHWFEQFYRQNALAELESPRLVPRRRQLPAEEDSSRRADMLCGGSQLEPRFGITVIAAYGGDVDRPSRRRLRPTWRILRRGPEFRQAASGERLAVAGMRCSDTLHDEMLFVALPVLRATSRSACVQASMPLEAVDAAIADDSMARRAGGLAHRPAGDRRQPVRVAADRAGRWRKCAGGASVSPAASSATSCRARIAKSWPAGRGAQPDGRPVARAHQHVVRQNNEQQAVLSSMVEGVLAVDNERAHHQPEQGLGPAAGHRSASGQGRPLQEVVRNADLRRFVSRALACREPIDDDVVVHGDHEGVLQARGAALHDALGHGIGAVVVLNDVTDFRRLEHIRRDFVANVSHELKTPITSIKGFVETLLDGAMHNADDTERFLPIIAKQADRLNAIIEDLLSLSKIEQGEETADIALVRRPRARSDRRRRGQLPARGPTERQIHVRTACDDAVVAEINTQLLEQAVVNLLDNAIKYSEPGSEVQVLGSRSAAKYDHGGRPRLRHRRRTSVPRLRAILSRRQSPQPQARRHRPGSGDRQAHRAGPPRPGTRGQHPGQGQHFTIRLPSLRHVAEDAAGLDKDKGMIG